MPLLILKFLGINYYLDYFHYLINLLIYLSSYLLIYLFKIDLSIPLSKQTLRYVACFFFFFFLLCRRGKKLNFIVCRVREGSNEKEAKSLTGTVGEESLCEIGLGGNRTLERSRDLLCFSLAQF